MTEPDKQISHKMEPWVSSVPLQIMLTKCGAAIARSIFSRIITTDTPWLTRQGDTRGVICELKL